MIIRLVIVLLFTIGSALASEFKAPYEFYRVYDFDIENIPKIENSTRDLAKRWQLSIVEKNREHMKIASLGREAFDILLFYDDELVVSIGNTGPSVILSLMFYLPAGYSEENLKEIISEFKNDLECRFKLNLMKQQQ